MTSQKAGEEKVAEDKERKERGERKEKGKRKKGKKKGSGGSFEAVLAVICACVSSDRTESLQEAHKV